MIHSHLDPVLSNGQIAQIRCRQRSHPSVGQWGPFFLSHPKDQVLTTSLDYEPFLLDPTIHFLHLTEAIYPFKKKISSA